MPKRSAFASQEIQRKVKRTKTMAPKTNMLSRSMITSKVLDELFGKKLFLDRDMARALKGEEMPLWKHGEVVVFVE